jgi:hypothetical protein
MKNLLLYIKQCLGYLVLPICLLCVQGCGSVTLPDEEIPKELQNDDKALQQARNKKEKKEIDGLVMEYTYIDDADKAKGPALEKLAEALYRSLKNGYPQRCAKIIVLSQARKNLTWNVVGRALNRALQQDKSEDLHKVLKRLTWVQEADKRNEDTVIDYIVGSWLKAPASVQAWQTALDELNEEYPIVEYYKFNQVVLHFIELAKPDAVPALEQKFNETNKNALIRRYEQYNVLLKAIPLHPSSDSYYNLSLSEDREEGYYSDSEEEEAPRFNWIYNYTKFSLQGSC